MFMHHTHFSIQVQSLIFQEVLSTGVCCVPWPMLQVYVASIVTNIHTECRSVDCTLAIGD